MSEHKSTIRHAILPNTAKGNDPNDNRDSTDYLDNLILLDQANRSKSAMTMANLPPLDISQLLSEPPKESQFLFRDRDGDGLIPIGYGAGMAAPGGTGKSMIALGLGYAMAIGGLWLRRYQAFGAVKVFFFTSEEQEEEIHRRFRDLHEYYCATNGICGVKKDEIETLAIQNLSIFTVSGIPTQLTCSDTNRGFINGPAVDDLINRIDSVVGDESSILILDPLRSFAAGNEDGAAFTAVIQACDTIRRSVRGTCTSFLVHHSSQASLKELDQSEAAFRGATDLTNGLRWTMVVQRLSDKEAKRLGIAEVDSRSYRQYSFPKTNYSASRFGMCLKYTSGTFEDVKLSSMTTLNKEVKQAKAIPILIQVLHDLVNLGDPVSAGMIMQKCSANDEGGEYIPVAKNRDALRTLLLEAQKKGLVEPYEALFPANRKRGEAWRVTGKSE